MPLLFALEDTHRAPNYGILDSAPIPQGCVFTETILTQFLLDRTEKFRTG